MLQEERERRRRQAEQWEALLKHTLTIVRKAVGKRKERMPSADSALPWTAATKHKQQRRAELREAREMAESLVAESEAADLRCNQEARQEEQDAARAAQQAELEKHGGFQAWFEHGLSADAREALRERSRAFKLLREAEGEQQDGAASDVSDA